MERTQSAPGVVYDNREAPLELRGTDVHAPPPRPGRRSGSDAATYVPANHHAGRFAHQSGSAPATMRIVRHAAGDGPREPGQSIDDSDTESAIPRHGRHRYLSFQRGAAGLP